MSQQNKQEEAQPENSTANKNFDFISIVFKTLGDKVVDKMPPGSGYLAISSVVFIVLSFLYLENIPENYRIWLVSIDAILFLLIGLFLIAREKKLDKISDEKSKLDLNIQNAAALYKETLEKEVEYLDTKIEQLKNVKQELKYDGLQDSQLESLVQLIQELLARKNELDQKIGLTLNEVIKVFSMDKKKFAKAIEKRRKSLKSSHDN